MEGLFVKYLDHIMGYRHRSIVPTHPGCFPGTSNDAMPSFRQDLSRNPGHYRKESSGPRLKSCRGDENKKRNAAKNQICSLRCASRGNRV